MADPSLRLTYDDLRIRVAEYLGIGYYGASADGAAQVPVDPHDLDKVSRVVNNGYRRFLTDNEYGWNFMTVPLSITFLSGTVSGDNARYYLPDDSYGVLLSPFTYPSGGPRLTITQTSEQELRELQWSNATGVPTICAVRAINTNVATTAQRWEVVFWPTPNAVYTVSTMYKRYPTALSSGTDRPVSGFQHDQTVLEACLAAAELEVGDSQGPHEAQYSKFLKQSLKIDRRASAPSIQGYGDKSEDRGGPRRPKTYYGVDTYNGNSLL